MSFHSFGLDLSIYQQYYNDQTSFGLSDCTVDTSADIINDSSGLSTVGRVLDVSYIHLEADNGPKEVNDVACETTIYKLEPRSTLEELCKNTRLLVPCLVLQVTYDCAWRQNHRGVLRTSLEFASCYLNRVGASLENLPRRASCYSLTGLQLRVPGENQVSAEIQIGYHFTPGGLCYYNIQHALPDDSASHQLLGIQCHPIFRRYAREDDARNTPVEAAIRLVCPLIGLNAGLWSQCYSDSYPMDGWSVERPSIVTGLIIPIRIKFIPMVSSVGMQPAPYSQAGLYPSELSYPGCPPRHLTASTLVNLSVRVKDYLVTQDDERLSCMMGLKEGLDLGSCTVEPPGEPV
jgi:hypothetical protein